LKRMKSSGAHSHLVSVRANTFRENDGGAGGGAIGFIDLLEEARRLHVSAATIKAWTQLPPGRFVFAYNHFENNRGDAAGAIAADIAHTEGLTSTGDIFIGNTAGGNGGAASVSGGSLQLTHTLLKGNHASSRGAALFIAPGAKATVANSLVIGNVGPADTLAGGPATIANVTIADNEAAGLALDDPSSHVVHTILARNKPGDCAMVDGTVFQGVNAASDASCPGLAPTDVALDALYVPTSRQALGAGNAIVCRAAPVGGKDLSRPDHRADRFEEAALPMPTRAGYHTPKPTFVRQEVVVIGQPRPGACHELAGIEHRCGLAPEIGDKAAFGMFAQRVEAQDIDGDLLMVEQGPPTPVKRPDRSNARWRATQLPAEILEHAHRHDLDRVQQPSGGLQEDDVQSHGQRDYQEFRAGLGMMRAKEPNDAAPQRTSHSRRCP
jgi:hypothetical protein